MTINTIDIRALDALPIRAKMLGASLRNRRAWYADDLPSDPAELARFAADLLRQKREANAEAAQYRHQLTELRQKQTDDAARLLAEQGQFKTLAEQRLAELQTAQEQAKTAEAYRAALQAQNAQKIAQLPESARVLVPELGDPIALAAWLDKATPVLNAPTPPKMSAGERGAPSPNLPPEIIALARAMKVDPANIKI